jgi:large subunit ribosomal protein L35
MPKIKTNRGAAKRFKLTGTGKVKRKKAYHSHILSTKTTKRKRKLRKGTLVAKSEVKNVKKMIPYAK